MSDPDVAGLARRLERWRMERSRRFVFVWWLPRFERDVDARLMLVFPAWVFGRDIPASPGWRSVYRWRLFLGPLEIRRCA